MGVLLVSDGKRLLFIDASALVTKGSFGVRLYKSRKDKEEDGTRRLAALHI